MVNVKLCAVCGYLIPDGYKGLTCSNRCSDEFEQRKERAKEHKKDVQQLKQKTYMSANDITIVVKNNFARVLLDMDIPTYTSNCDIDIEICKRDDWFNKLNRSYRKSCITKNISSFGYVMHSTTSNGKRVYKLVEDRNIIRNRIVSMTSPTRGG